MDGSWTVTTTNTLASLTITTPATFAGALVLNVNETWTNSDGSSTGAASVVDNLEAYAPGAPIFAVSGNDTLTGGGGNDEFVFAQPIGNDTVYNFNVASDQIDLIGFNNFTTFVDIQANMADDANGNAVITAATGESVTIVGVDAAALTASDFVLNQEPLTNSAGTMTVGDAAMLPLGGTIDNTGTIALNSTGDETDLEVLVNSVTLQGGGQVTLSDSSENVIFGGASSATLTNVDNTISGAGRLGDGQMTLVNDGTIDATGTNALVLDNGSNVIDNSAYARGDWQRRANRQQCGRQLRQLVGEWRECHFRGSGCRERDSDDFRGRNSRIRRRLGRGRQFCGWLHRHTQAR